MIESLRDLESIKLWKCDSVKVIFQLEELNAEESHVASVLDQLRELDLSDLPKLEHIWVKGPERITGFENLRFLAVQACNSLTYLLSPSIAKLLVMLEDIKVNNCEKIEEILEIASEEEKEKKISFYKVKSIWLEDLPNLKCFCNEVNAFKWPSLKKITVIRCRALCTFVPSDLINTPKLEGVYGQNESDQQTMFPWRRDLNATIQDMFKGEEKQVDQETRLQGKNMSSVEGDEDLMNMEICKPITEKIKNLLERIRQQIGYQSHLNSNIKNLKDRFEMLHDKRFGVELQIDEAERNGQIIAPVVIRWVEKVHNISEDLERFLDDVKANKTCLDEWCPNPKTRYSLSRKAKKKTLEIDGLLSVAPFVTRMYYSPPPLVMRSLPIEGIMHLESRTKMRREVLEALRADKVNMIAICGMGGIGKTTMAKEIAKRAKDDKLFDEVVMAVVSQTPGLEMIQGQIAEMLGLEFDEEYPLARAERLRKRLMDSKSVLVILDDVWDAVDLEAVGIPYGGEHNRCKLLLTSRSEDACTRMKTQKIFPIRVLSEEEAWNLFREMAGNCIDTPNLHPIAKEVAKECGGLPVAIVTVGRALENKSEVEWTAALQRLKKASPKNIPGLDLKVYSSIKLSYNYLGSDEAKSCFLLCCLFPEDYDILIEDLVRYGVGQRLFAKIDTVAEARNRVHAMVKNLKRSFLLLDSAEGKEHVKMHDVVRDVAISIAENKGFLVRCNETMEEWPEKDSCECSTAISLVSKELKRHPDGLECPKLELLQLSCDKDTLETLPPNLFKGMNGLKVLSLINMSFPSLPQSINVLQNLRTLQFVDCELTDVSAIGALTELEILSFIGSQIKELPEEMRNLSYLKLLELTKCSDLERIPPDLLSSLSSLEELYMFGVDVKWKPMEEEEEDEEEEEEKKRANASLTELMSLSHLVALKIQIPNIKVLPKDPPFKNETIKFQIFAGNNVKIDEHNFTEYYDYLIKNSLGIASCDVSDIAKSPMLLQLFKKSEILKLKEIKDLKNIVYELDKEGFQCLKVLEVGRSDDVEYVMDATLDQNPCAAFPTLESLELVDLPNLKEIYHSQFPKGSFSNIHSQLACFGELRSITLVYCRSLKNVFSLSIARGLFQLQNLEIDDCDDMEECFHKEGEDEIMFPQLTSVRLDSLPRLIGFCTGVGPVEPVQPSLNREVGRIGTDEVTNLEKHKMTDIQQHTVPFPESTPIISHKLFSSNTILWPPKLENLDLTKADSLQVVFDLEGLKVDENHQRIAVLAQLKTLEVKSSSKLGHVWKNVPRGIQGFQKLTSIKVSECHRLRYLFPTSIAKLLVELQSIEIEECDAIENIVQRDGEEEATDIILFPRVSSLKLRYLPNMMSFCIKAYSFEWSSIKEIYLRDCPKLKTIGSGIQSPRKSKKINREMDSRPNEHELGSPGFHWRYLECLPRRKNYDLMVVSDQGTTNKSQRSYSVKEEGTLSKPNDPKVGDSDNPSEIWSLFPSHIIECLKNLELIELIDVPSLEVIFQLEELNVEESHMAPVLDQLRELDLGDLPKLMHIWKKGSERILGFGNLRLLKVWDCNSLTYLFSPSIAKLLVMLEKIEVGNCKKIEEIFARAGEEEEEKESHIAPIPDQLRELVLMDLPKLVHIWKKGLERILGFGNLRLLEVWDCNSLTYLFSPSIAKLLVMLEKIKVSRCEKIEEILARAGEEEEEKESHIAPVLDQLRELFLMDLPKLVHIWKKGPERILGFGNLRLLEVWDCNSLTYLFSPSIAKLLVMLEKIEVGDCKKIEEILARAGEEEKEKDVLFDKVNSIVLHNLPNLKCFCSETNALKWPSLEEITVNECPSLSTFIPSNLNTPKLEGVYNAFSWEKERTCHWKGDLNATIEHIFKGKEKLVDH
ncbi:uncharacterized protein LOC126693402 [Quercus robur]|uniref:uncharacterized protein LOC126693402 n=1 Tax=Quercus robur TaxID=38942 RepID=UPI002163F926|nr:uncharacterized protein LOC126693402 [Quercus robur]